MTKKSTTTEAIQKGVFELLKNVNTSIPGNVLAFDADTQLAEVQIGLERIDINGLTYTPPPVIFVPVHFSGGDYLLETQIDVGTEGVLIVSQRCIDSWVDQGGVAPLAVKRFHNIDDSVFIPGFRSQPNKIPSFENNGIRLRNKAGDKYIWLKNDGTAEITVDTLTINGQISHTGDQTTIGTITGTVDVIAGTISGKDHLHDAGTPPGDVGVPK